MSEEQLLEQPQIFVAGQCVTDDDVQQLAEFLTAATSATERSFHRFLEEHPSLMGALGFTFFLSEYPVVKTDHENQPIADRRRRDRIDVLAAKQSHLPTNDGKAYRSGHIIELKHPKAAIAARVSPRCVCTVPITCWASGSSGSTAMAC